MTYDQVITELKSLGFQDMDADWSSPNPYPFVFLNTNGGLYFYHNDQWAFCFDIEGQYFLGLLYGSWGIIEDTDIASMIALYK